VIPRVWDDELALIKGDLAEWLRRQVTDRAWVPEKFELAFGLSARRDMDPDSRPEPVALDCGIQLRGSIDVVERGRGVSLRATDYKTGKASVGARAIISKGEALQPVLYALTLEKMFPEKQVTSGRLYYCTTNGGFEAREIALDDRARAAADLVASAIGEGLQQRFLPAAPREGACRWCDYQSVCGPYEEMRTARKSSQPLTVLKRVRRHP
jgi:CRISPR/Cas system-associated exonuclease Cas4 (RecB family)